MNSNFTNSNFGRILYIAIITLIVSATIFVIWYMTAGYKLGTYDPDTRLGNVYIGGLTEQEVEPRVSSKINTWYNDETIVFELKYQGYSYEFDRNLLFFDVDRSVKSINQATINEIQVYYQGDDRERVVSEINDLDFLDNVISNVNLDKLIFDMLYDASLMKSYSIKNIEDYFVDPMLNVEELDRADLLVPENFDLEELTEKINDYYPDGKIVAEKETLFDMLTVFSDNMTDAEVSLLASAMLELIVDTNFIINELHYEPITSFGSYDVNNYPYFGRNVDIVSVGEGDSFSFYNPNTSNYYFEIDLDTEELVLSGLPLEYEIDVEITKVILPFYFEENIDIEKHQDGHEGAMIVITRTIYDINGLVVTEPAIIISEFYPPQKAVGLVNPN